MDLNYLLYRHQISLDRSTNATSREARRAHAGTAKQYGEQIDALRLAMFPVNKAPRTLADGVAYGSARA